MSLPDELLQRYPYPHRLPEVLDAMEKHAATLRAGFERITQQAAATKAKAIVHYEVWAFMACDQALEQAQRAGTTIEVELGQVIRQSGTH